MAEHWRLKPEALGSIPGGTTFFLSLCRFKGLRTVTAQIISMSLRTWVSPVYRAPNAVIKSSRFFCNNNQACICFYQTTNSMWLSHLMCVQTVGSCVMSMGKPQRVHTLMTSFVWNVTMSMLGKMMQSLLFGCTIFRHESTSDTDPST